MGSIDVIDVAKIFSTSQNVIILDKIKRNSFAFRRLFGLCVGLHLAPKGMCAPNSRSIVNEISRVYGFDDFSKVENSPECALEVFKTPLKKADKVDWTRALKNNNYCFGDKEIASADFLCNRIFSFILAKGVDFDEFDVLVNFKPLPMNNAKVAIYNKEYSSPVLNSRNFYWEAIIANVSQYAVDRAEFNAEELSIELPLQELGEFSCENLAILISSCPSNLLSGHIKYNESQQKIKFFFSKNLLNRIQYKKYRKSFLEVLGLANINSPTFAT